MADILLVDDDSSVLLTLAIALRRRGHRVTVAGDAEQALRQLQLRPFEIMVSDVRMPGMSGVELARRVRRFKRPPRVVLTSAYSHGDLPLGASIMFMQKPLDVAQLGALVEAAA